MSIRFIAILMCLIGTLLPLPVFAQSGNVSTTLSLVVPLQAIPRASQTEYSSITAPAQALGLPLQVVPQVDFRSLSPVANQYLNNLYQVWVHI